MIEKIIDWTVMKIQQHFFNQKQLYLYPYQILKVEKIKNKNNFLMVQMFRAMTAFSMKRNDRFWKKVHFGSITMSFKIAIKTAKNFMKAKISHKGFWTQTMILHLKITFNLSKKENQILAKLIFKSIRI